MSTIELDPIQKLNKDLRKAAITLSTDEVRFLVSSYYQMQDNRKTADNQQKQLIKAEKPHEVITWLAQQDTNLENQIKAALDKWTASQELGQWARSIVGIGPVIAAGLMAHIDIEKAPTTGHILSFGGHYPGIEWEKGEKRPWNADLKTLFWKIGESFVKVSGNEKDIYGKVYLERKVYEIAKNLAGDYAGQAADQLTKFNYGKDTEAYKHYIQGHLPPGHIHSRCKRYAVKIFIAHYHHVAYELHYHKPPPRPWVIEHGGHTHFIAPPNWPIK